MWLAPSNSSTFFLNMKCVHENEHQRIAGNGSWFWDILVNELLGLTQIEKFRSHHDQNHTSLHPSPAPYPVPFCKVCMCVCALQMI